MAATDAVVLAGAVVVTVVLAWFFFEAAERRAEIRDLGSRVLLGALLTLPTVYAVMAGEVFGLPVPEWMHNAWVQLATDRARCSSTPAGRSTAPAGWRCAGAPRT
jgi:hypothetical protein